MGKKLFKSGHSYALILDAALLKLMKITPKSELELLAYNTAILIRRKSTKESKGGIRQQFKESTAMPDDATSAELAGKRLFKQGNSYAIVIDKLLLDVMDFTPDTELEIRPYGRAIMIRKHIIKLTPEEKERKKLQEEYEKDLRDPMRTFATLDDAEETVSQKLVLVDGKWVLPERGVKIVDKPHTLSAQEILEAIREEEKKEKLENEAKARIQDSGVRIQKKEKNKKLVGRPAKVGGVKG